MSEKRTAESVRQWLRYLFPDELAHLIELAQSLPPYPTIVNIGAGGGTSGLAFMEARDDLTLITIDIQDESSPNGCLEAERKMFAEAGYPRDNQLWVQVHGDSKRIRWENGLPITYMSGLRIDKVVEMAMADMVFIDGDHSYRGCAGDIAAWLPRIRPGGILAIHDYEKEKVFANRKLDDAPHPMAWPGVDKAVSEFFNQQSHTYTKYEIVETLISFQIREW